MSGKRNSPVCRGHELANALYVFTDREGTKCPKKIYWGEDRIKRKIYE